MILMTVTRFYSLIYRKGVSGCFITNCYGCLNAISVNPNTRNCKNRKECKVCKKRHPISLHGYTAEKSKVKRPDGNSSEESKGNINCTTANTKSDVISMCIVPVLVRHKLSNWKYC